MRKKQIKYSRHEQRVFAALRRQPLSTVAITELFYSPEFQKRFGRKKRPRFAIISVRCTLEQLKRKVQLNGESYRIRKSARRGPKPVDFWIEDKAVRASVAGAERVAAVA